MLFIKGHWLAIYAFMHDRYIFKWVSSVLVDVASFELQLTASYFQVISDSWDSQLSVQEELEKGHAIEAVPILMMIIIIISVVVVVVVNVEGRIINCRFISERKKKYFGWQWPAMADDYFDLKCINAVLRHPMASDKSTVTEFFFCFRFFFFVLFCFVFICFLLGQC